MKILIISDAWHPQVNGVVRTYENICDALTKRGHHTNVIGPALFPFRMPMPGYSEIELAILPYNLLSRLIQDYDPDHIHIATEGPLGWAGRRYCLKNKRPFTTSYHTHFPDYVAKRIAKYLPFLYEPVHKFAKSIVRRFHAPSQAIMIATQSVEDLLTEWNFKAPKARLTRGIDQNLFTPAPASKFQDLPKPVALYVGRVAIEKNIEEFLDMPWQGSKVIVGHGPALDALKKRYPKAHFLGKLICQDLAACYQSADIFAFPSRTDTFGIVLIEALACGLPVAAYNVTGPMDIITDPRLGALVDKDFSKAALKALETADPSFCAAHAHEQYTWDKAAEQFETIILS